MRNSKFLLLFLFINYNSINAIIVVEIINNSIPGIKATYNPQSSHKMEQFIESKKSFITPALKSDNISGLENTYALLINTYKGPLALDIITHNKIVKVSERLTRRGRNSFAQHVAPVESIQIFDIKAELSSEYPISNATFTSGRPWDEYKIQVTVEEKLENSKVTIKYKSLEKPEEMKLIPTTRPALRDTRQSEGPIFGRGVFSEGGEPLWD